VAVAHLASEERATQLAAALQARLAQGLEGRQVVVGEVGAVLGAHVGPGMVAVSVARRD
jgi:fatty acid-binding protein DegV